MEISPQTGSLLSGNQQHIGFSAAAIGVVAGIPYLFNELQKLSIAENEAAQRQLDQLMFITVSPEFDVIEVSKQQAFIRGGSGNLDSGDKWNFCLTSA